MPTWSVAILLVIVAAALNVPLGYQREQARRFSPAWFLWVHLSIPLIVLLRLRLGFGWMLIPGTLAGAVAGQLVGGWLRRRHERAR